MAVLVGEDVLARWQRRRERLGWCRRDNEPSLLLLLEQSESKSESCAW